MPLDYSRCLYDPLYDAFGVEAVFSSPLVSEIVLTVIDDTKASKVDGDEFQFRSREALQVRSVDPGAFVRIQELISQGIEKKHYYGATLEFNGKKWIVRNYVPIGNPNGEDMGELRFLLTAAEISTDGS